MNTSLTMRPKLKQDSVFFQTQDGVFVRSDKTAFMLKGKSVYRWLSALSPFMTGEHTLDAICDGLEAGQRDLVVQLVTTLMHRGVVKDSIPEDPGLLANRVQDYFKSQIEFIDHFVDHPLERFKSFRESRILLIGSGEANLALATALVRNGVQEIFLTSAGEMPPGSRSALEKEVEALNQQGIEAKITRIDRNAPEASIHFNDFRIIVYCSDDSSMDDVLLWQRRCLREGIPFLPAAVFGEKAILGPLVETQGMPCWLCALLRLSINVDEKFNAALWRELALGKAFGGDVSNFFLPQAWRVGNGLAFELFKFFTQSLPPETRNGIILQDLETLESYAAGVIPHPLCPECSHESTGTAIARLQESVAGKHDKEFATQEDLYHQVTALLNKWTGIFKEFRDDKLTQVPLKVSHLETASPASPLAKNIAVTTYSTETLQEARIFAMQEALLRYTQSLPDKRALLVSSLQALEERGIHAIPAHRLGTWSGSPSFKAEMICEWVPAYGLFSQSLHYVPAAAAYPFTWLNRSHLFEMTTAGSAAAINFADVVAQGMLSALAYEELQGVIQGSVGVERLEIATWEEMDPTLTYLVRCASHFDRTFSLLGVQTEAPLHLVVACTTDTAEKPITSVGFGLSSIDALKKVFTSLVGQLQHLKYEGNIPVLDENLIPGFSLHSDFIHSSAVSNGYSKPTYSLEDVNYYLREKGKEALFINLTTNDIWEKGPFISGTVLLARTVPQLPE